MTQRAKRGGHAGAWLPLVAALALASGCAYPVRNQPATIISDTHGYQFAKLEPSAAEDTLVIVTLSGGGTRATALGLSVLQGLDKIALPKGETLAGEVDVISSVSGGSVTAAYFALAGSGGFKRLEDYICSTAASPTISAFWSPIAC